MKTTQIIAATLLLTACATGTPYQAKRPAKDQAQIIVYHDGMRTAPLSVNGQQCELPNGNNIVLDVPADKLVILTSQMTNPLTSVNVKESKLVLTPKANERIFVRLNMSWRSRVIGGLGYAFGVGGGHAASTALASEGLFAFTPGTEEGASYTRTIRCEQ